MALEVFFGISFFFESNMSLVLSQFMGLSFLEVVVMQHKVKNLVLRVSEQQEWQSMTVDSQLDPGASAEMGRRTSPKLRSWHDRAVGLMWSCLGRARPRARAKHDGARACLNPVWPLDPAHNGAAWHAADGLSYVNTPFCHLLLEHRTGKACVFVGCLDYAQPHGRFLKFCRRVVRPARASARTCERADAYKPALSHTQN
jgi:hypothetical protein